MTYKEIVREIAEKTGLPRTLVDKTYKGFWRAVKEHIETLPLKEGLSDEEFESLQPNVNIPSLGKFNIVPSRYKLSMKTYRKLMQESDSKENI